jgi:hypothetical protein
MRVLIIKQPTGTVDGVELRKLVEGRVYDVPASLATFLVVSKWAEPVEDDGPALVVPVDHPLVVELIRQRDYD